jgi:hypothetical protein
MGVPLVAGVNVGAELSCNESAFDTAKLESSACSEVRLSASLANFGDDQPALAHGTESIRW